MRSRWKARASVPADKPARVLPFRRKLNSIVSVQVRHAGQLWASFGSDPPLDAIANALRVSSWALVAETIDAVGQAGRLNDYRKCFCRLVRIKEQARRERLRYLKVWCRERGLADVVRDLR